MCHSKCGSSGCEVGSQDKCCHKECLGGCTKANSPFHCNACQNLRLQNGSCVAFCPPGLKEVLLTVSFCEWQTAPFLLECTKLIDFMHVRDSRVVKRARNFDLEKSLPENTNHVRLIKWNLRNVIFTII